MLQIIFNLERAPFDQVALRRAVAHAIDRQRIVEQVTHGGAVVANLGIVSPSTEWANPALHGYAHDPVKARQILQEAGLANQAVTIIQSARDREAELIRADLEAIGLQVTVKSGDRTTIDGLLKEGRFDLAISGHGGIANPSTLRTPTWPATTYQNEAYDALFMAQSVEMDEEERKEQIWALQEILAEELPVLPLYHPLMWVVYEAEGTVVPFYTSEGIAGGIPIELNKLIFLER
jgi:peptide/nickel transport system substrate-binding protein